MAKEMRDHNLLNFRQAISNLPGTEWKEAEATSKDKETGKETKWTFKYPVLSDADFLQIVETLGADNIVANLNDISKVVFRSAPTEEKLFNDAIANFMRLGLSKEDAENAVRKALAK